MSVSATSSHSSSINIVPEERRRASILSSIGNNVAQREEELIRSAERSLISTSGSVFRQFSFDLVESRYFNYVILIVICVNTITIGLETSRYLKARYGWYFSLLDELFLAIYILEIVLKIIAWHFKFFKNAWNVLDFTIVLGGLVDFMIPLILDNIGMFDVEVLRILQVFFHTIRALRVLRVLRTLRFLKSLQIIVTTVVNSIPAMGTVFILMTLVLYIFAVIGRRLYGSVDPGRFGNLAKACYTLFQLITLDNWFYVYTDVRDSHSSHQHILVYLILFIILETLIFINLFVAVIVDNLAGVKAAANYTSHRQPKTSAAKVSEDETNRELGVRFAQDHPSVTSYSVDEDGSNDAHTYAQRHFADYYASTVSERRLSARELKLIVDYLNLLTCLDHQLHVASKHQTTLNELVDTNPRPAP